jgi:bacterioferritin-associated ferredoxin
MERPMSTDTVSRDVTISDDENIICGCTSLSLAALRRRIAQNPGLAFEQLTAETGAGTKCTACLLDLEYYFVEGQRAPGAGPLVKDDDEKTTAAKLGLKQRVYRWLDSISPMVPYPFTNTVPVVYGDGIEQWLWITNRSMLFEGNKCAPSMRIDLTLRDAAGRVVLTERKDVLAETSWRYELSSPLAKATPALKTDELGCGSVEIRRSGLSVGVRGTTRPQIEIVTRKAACAVHSQAMSGPGPHWFGCLYRPQYERMFFGMLNGTDRPQKIEIRYPIGISGVEPITQIEHLPANGAGVHELKLPEHTAKAVAEKAVTITWRGESFHKLWAICATPNLDRFSIDHL